MASISENTFRVINAQHRTTLTIKMILLIKDVFAIENT